MIKELLILVMMLFGKKPKDIENVRLMEMKHFPFKGYVFLFWCGRMIYSYDTTELLPDFGSDSYERMKNHEMIHLMQAKICGSWWKYYWRYFVQWLKGNPLLHPSTSAYYTIPYECEAYANEENMDYCKNYDGSNLQKYTFKRRKKLYKNVGSSKEWKAYLKTL